MDFWKKQVEQAQVLAKQASANANVFAQQLSEKSKAIAVQAHEKATETAEKARLELANVNIGTSMRDAAMRIKADIEVAAERTRAAGPSGGDLTFTPEFKSHVAALTYSTFREHQSSHAGGLSDTGKEAGRSGVDSSEAEFMSDEQPLSPEQVLHARCILEQVDQLSGLRFTLCPRHMPEPRFWQLYFHLMAPHMPGTVPDDAEEPTPEGPSGAAAEEAGPRGAGSEPPAQEAATEAGAMGEVTSLEEYMGEEAGGAGDEEAGSVGGDFDDINDDDLDEYLNEMGDADGDLEGMEDLDDEYLGALDGEDLDGEVTLDDDDLGDLGELGEELEAGGDASDVGGSGGDQSSAAEPEQKGAASS